MIFCETCKYLKPMGFGALNLERNKFSDSFNICCHPLCFSVNNMTTPEGKKEIHTRIYGQKQLNKDNDCCQYEKYVWWKHKWTKWGR